MLKQKIQSLSSILSHNIFMANLSIFIVLVLFIGMYLSQINNTTQLGLAQEEVKSNLVTAQEMNKDLQLEVAEYQSIVSLQARIENMAFAHVSQVGYVSVTVPIGAVAKR